MSKEILNYEADIRKIKIRCNIHSFFLTSFYFQKKRHNLNSVLKQFQKIFLSTLICTSIDEWTSFPQSRPKWIGCPFGILPTAKTDAITDLAGVQGGTVYKNRGKLNSGRSHGSYPHSRKSFSAPKSASAILRGKWFWEIGGVTQSQEPGIFEVQSSWHTLSVAAGIRRNRFATRLVKQENETHPIRQCP